MSKILKVRLNQAQRHACSRWTAPLEEFEGVAVVEADVVAWVVEDGRGEFDGGFGGHRERAGWKPALPLIDQDR